MLGHVRNHYLIEESQHGFLRNRSCLTNLLEFLEYVSNYVDQGYPIDVTILETRIIRGYLIKVLKIFRGEEDLDPCIFFELKIIPTRGHSLKLFKPSSHLNVKKFLFAHRGVDLWNNLD